MILEQNANIVKNSVFDFYPEDWKIQIKLTEENKKSFLKGVQLLKENPEFEAISIKELDYEILFNKQEDDEEFNEQQQEQIDELYLENTFLTSKGKLYTTFENDEMIIDAGFSLEDFMKEEEE